MKRQEIKIKNRIRSCLFKALEETGCGYSLKDMETGLKIVKKFESEQQKKLRELLYISPR